jgi:hypothetical protein
MKKILVLILAVLPLVSGAQSIDVLRRPIVLNFDGKQEFQKFVVPSGRTLHIYNIYSDADVTKLKLTIRKRISANENGFTQSLTFSRLDRANFSREGLNLPEQSTIEYDGIPIIIFCQIE